MLHLIALYIIFELAFSEDTMRYFLLLVLSLIINSVTAQTYSIPQDGSNVVGEMSVITAQKGDTLSRIAVRSGVGHNEIIQANPQLKGRKNLRIGTPVIIPSAYILPDVERRGIVINLPAMRLYYFPDEYTVMTFPVAVGKSGWSTPRGLTQIVQKKRHPTWTPPQSIRREAARRGRTLRRVYPAGPSNPLGTRALRLGMPGYLIHGTNKPWTIGQRRSHGCVRMRKDDVEQLFDLVSVGTPVRIISQKVGMPELPVVDSSSAYPEEMTRQATTQKRTLTKRTTTKRTTIKRTTTKRPKKKHNTRKTQTRRKGNIQTQKVAGYQKPIDFNDAGGNTTNQTPLYFGDDGAFQSGYQNITDSNAFSTAGE